MEIYLLCFDLSGPMQEQQDQIASWLQIVSSSLPNPSQFREGIVPSNNSKNWRIVVVGLQEDQVKPSEVTIAQESLMNWKFQHPTLPLHDQLFEVSALNSRESVQQLLTAIDSISSQIFSQRTVLIPPVFRKVLQPIKQLLSHDQPSHLSALHKKIRSEMDLPLVKQALRFFHRTGHVVLLPKGLFCSPMFIQKLISKFIDHSIVPSGCTRDLDQKFALHINSQNPRLTSCIANMYLCS